MSTHELSRRIHKYVAAMPGTRNALTGSTDTVVSIGHKNGGQMYRLSIREAEEYLAWLDAGNLCTYSEFKSIAKKA